MAKKSKGKASRAKPKPKASAAPNKPEKITRSDMLRLRHAARGNWNVPDQVRTEALVQVYELLTGKDAGPRDKLAAARVLVGADRADLMSERLDLLRQSQAGEAPRESAAELVRQMQAAGVAYERRAAGGGEGGAAEVPDGPGAVQ